MSNTDPHRASELANRGATAAARTFVFVLSPASTIFATKAMGDVMVGTPTPLLADALLILFSLSFLWLAFAFWSGILGFFVTLFRLDVPGQLTAKLTPRYTPGGRTAILMPVRNEDPARTIGSIEAMDEQLARLGIADHFHFFILSDTNKPALWIEEELAWARLVARRGAGSRIFYRRRPINLARKSGNIADFVERWGAGYDYMLMLDADSLMSGETMLTLVNLMDQHAEAGLIQVPTLPQGRSTVYGRLLQFAASAYGSMFTRGLAFWLGDEATYWGHNAIARTSVFAAHCGLPKRPGRAPFGGEILSHDVVEAALIRRAGYKVYITTELEGSYEEAPANLVEYAKRDRRWCQGNLQHIPLIFAHGFHPINRLQLALGVAAYLIAPFWFLYIVLSLANAAAEKLHVVSYFSTAHAMAPDWPIDASVRALPILFSVMGMLFLPRALALLLTLVNGERRRLHGGLSGMLNSSTVETVLSTLFAPLLMIFQTKAVLEIFLGRDAGWPATAREEGTVSWLEAISTHVVHMIVGAALITTTIELAPDLILWLLPVSVPLIFSPALAVLSGSTRAGNLLHSMGCLITPEESDPPSLILRARALTQAAARERAVAQDPVSTVTSDPTALAVHRLLLRNTPLEGAVDARALRAARSKLGLIAGEGAGTALTDPEAIAVLLDVESLETLFARKLARPSPEVQLPRVK
jgi:membrane glycosyltransferase